jgi:sorbitol/mannitol transport system substrate-binding protein
LNTTSRILAFIGASAIVLSASSPPSAIAQSTTTLTIATVNNPQMVDMQHAVGDFEKSTGIKVNFETLPENTLRQKVTADIATGGGQFDIATVGTYEVPIWAKNKWIVNLDPFFSKLDAAGKADYDLADVIPSIRKGLSYDGSLYAVPFYGESSMTFYNKRIFKAAGLTMPEHPTWDQIAGFAQKLNDPSKNQYGICLRGLPGWGEMGAPMTTVINTFGGQWFDMKWQPTLNTGATKTAITFYLDTIKKYGEPGASSAGFTECETNFTQSKVAMWVDATSASGVITDPKQSKVADDVGFAFSPTKVTPKGSHWLWAWSLAMESSSKHKDEAFKFLTWATNKKYIRLIASTNGWGNVPPGTRLSTFSDPNYKKAAPYGNLILESIQTADPTNSTLNKVPYTGVQFVGIPEFQEIGTKVTQNLAAALTGASTVDAALDLSQQQTTRTMQQAGYYK